MVHVCIFCRKMYVAVEFTDEKGALEVIPENWLEGTSCTVWPVYRSDDKNRKATRDREQPRLLGQGRYDITTFVPSL
jgi:hypothetical protein